MKYFLIILIFLGLGCKSNPNVELVDYHLSTYEYYEGYYPYLTYYYYAVCSGQVNNTGKATAHNVRITVTFTPGGSHSRLIDSVNLKPDEIGNFWIYSDTITQSERMPIPRFSIAEPQIIYDEKY